MDDNVLKQFFAVEDIPAPDDNTRKAHLNLAVAAFEQHQKNIKTSQGKSLFSRLINRQPNKRREEMHFSKKKVIYGGLATACVALMVFGIAPEVIQNSGARINADMKDIKATSPVQENMAMAVTDSIDAGAAMKEKMVQNAEAELTKKAPIEAKQDARMKAESVAVPQESAPAGSVVGYAANKLVAARSAAPIPMSVAVDEMSNVQKDFGRDKFIDVDENSIHQTAVDPVSTFSIDVDTASYSYMRSSLVQGVLPQKDSVRVEEMVNYFDYAYPLPQKKDEPFSTNVVLKPSPWGAGKQLVTIGIKGYDIPKTQMPNSNLVFLLDTSGSMDEANKLPLLKQSILLLLDSLKPTDTVSIVVYAGSAGTVLQPTKVADKAAILLALQNLSAGGGTAGAEGIRQAYQLASVNFDKNAVNRVILGTDGDFNVGITSPEELKDFVAREKDKGIFLSVLGFGRGNYNDEMMQKLAQNGNGVAAYIDNLNEARKVLVEEATSTLFPIAKDVKIQVEFNPATVAEYRLVGYETRALKTEDFNNDKVDAGDIGAGAEVTAMYEVTPVGGQATIDTSRYNPSEIMKKGSVSNELAFVKIRYKLPNENESKLITTPVAARAEPVSQLMELETNWAISVASFAQMLKGGNYTGQMTYDDIIRLAEANKGTDPYGYRAEFIGLVRSAKTAAGLQAQPNGQQGGIPQPDVHYPYPVPMTR